MDEMEIIQSPQNAQVKEWAALLTRKGREKAGKFLVEGVHLVSEALRGGNAGVETVLYVPGTAAERELRSQKANEASYVRWTAVTDKVMAKVTDAVTPQGIAAIIRMPTVDLHKLFRADRSSSYIAVDAVQDPGNLGTIIRSADAVCAAAVLLGEGTVDVYNPKTVRATMGSIFHLPVVSCDLHAALPLAAKTGVRVMTATLAARQNCFEADLTGPVCFLLGNEGAGVSPKLVELAQDGVNIPIPGHAESLNVGVAASILLYEALRQRCYRFKEE